MHIMRSDRPETISSDTLKQSYWLLGHLPQFRRNTVRTLIVIEGIVIFLAVLQFGFYLYYALVRQEKIIVPLRASAEYASPTITIPDPSVLAYGAVAQGLGDYDLYAQVKNLNQGWRADFDFLYSVNGVDQPPQKMFLLPLEEKYVLKVGISTQTAPQVSTRIANLAWRRLSKDDVTAIADRNQFEVKDIKIEPVPSSQGASGGTKVSFTLVDHSVYKFWDFRVPVVLKQGVAVTAVALVPVFSIDRDENKHLEAQWDYPVRATSFEIIPDIDILNPATIRPAL